jgi:hypothetical protein
VIDIEDVLPAASQVLKYTTTTTATTTTSALLLLI